jgi:hypothetical protein
MNKKPRVVQMDDQLSHYLQTEDKYGNPVNVPVIDVRDGMAERALGTQMIKATNRSKFIQYNEYHVSRKRLKQNQ